ncbi:hypothetical protein Bpfe_011203 [Biomphalaria pfeifferi]|uniref:Uncharacterized protein n=1 Tax=Biomphalaria pfeifferi TaxID=112525 RepID=A0AAD8FDP9_BIOPF|nr:hypothetical protein Bpfe_011203 [Biomphalaria pfeifferi]
MMSTGRDFCDFSALWPLLLLLSSHCHLILITFFYVANKQLSLSHYLVIPFPKQTGSLPCYLITSVKQFNYFVTPSPQRNSLHTLSPDHLNQKVSLPCHSITSTKQSHYLVNPSSHQTVSLPCQLIISTKQSHYLVNPSSHQTVSLPCHPITSIYDQTLIKLFRQAFTLTKKDLTISI